MLGTVRAVVGYQYPVCVSAYVSSPDSIRGPFKYPIRQITSIPPKNIEPTGLGVSTISSFWNLAGGLREMMPKLHFDKISERCKNTNLALPRHYEILGQDVLWADPERQQIYWTFRLVYTLSVCFLRIHIFLFSIFMKMFSIWMKMYEFRLKFTDVCS